MSFTQKIYQPCLEKCKTKGNIESNFRALDHGVSVLDDESKCDQYIAFYGGHHSHKLYQAFTSTNFRYTAGRKIEIIDWGCGQALATCILIDYLIEKNIQPDVVSITLVDPSLISLKRGFSFVCQMLENQFDAVPTVHLISKFIDDLEPRFLITHEDTIKVHLFSNIIDVETFSLEKLYKLILDTFHGRNRFICTSPANHRKHRLDKFYNLFSSSHALHSPITCDAPLTDKEIFLFKTGRYEKQNITRCERQFSVDLI